MSITGEERDNFNNRKRVIPEDRDRLYHGVPTVEFDTVRDEKPWQRVIYEVTRKGTHLYEPVKSIPSTLLILLVGVYLLLGYLTQLVEDDMPWVINENDIARDNTDTFSEEAAWRDLMTILGDAPRVSGTKYHLQKTIDLKALLDSIARDANLPVRVEWQMLTADYWIAFNPPYVNQYQNVSNVIALLEGESGFHSNGSIGTSLLVNCHYDSVPYAIGASDDGIFCAVMVETLRKLSRRSQKLKHNVIFIFNGAEENPLQGSHAFTLHPWSRGVTNVINLDAGGMNGKPIVFQVTDPRALDIYKRVTNRPSGQSVGEFMFSSGMIPSDTDFRIWRDFGQYHGLDIAFIKWGHLYHTRNDHPDFIRTGVIQNAGNMVLRLVTDMAATEELAEKVDPQAAVYFDYMNWFMVSYSFGAAVAVDLAVAVFAGLSVAYYVWLVGPRWSTVQELLFSSLGRLLAAAGGVLVSAILIPIMVATTTQMRYLSEPWIVVPMFWLPYIITAVGISQTFDAWRTKKSGLNRSIRALQAMTATRSILAALLLLMVCVPSLTTVRYMVAVPLFIMSLMSLVSMTVVRYFRMPAWLHLIMEVLLSLPTTMFMFSLALRFTALLLPIMGRTVSNVPDYTIGVVNLGLAILVSTSVSGIELLFSRKRLWIVAAVPAVACIIIMFVPFSPFRDEGPATQRHYWFHSEITSYGFDGRETERAAGVVVARWDAYTASSVLRETRQRGLAVNHRTDFANDCERHVHCNLPLFRMRFGEYLKDSLLLYTGPPNKFSPEPSTRVASRSCVGELCTFNLRMIGPAHNLITIWPRPNVNVTSWSFTSPVLPSFELAGRPVYSIIHSTPTYSESFLPLDFTLTLLVPLSQQSQPIMDLSHHAHKIHHPEDYTQEYRNLLDAMPRFFNIASYLSFRNNYIF